MANGGNRRPLRPRGTGGAGGRRRRVVIDNQAARPRQDSRQARAGRDDRTPKSQQPATQQTGPVSVESGVTVRDLSQALGVTMSQIIKILMGLGAPKTATQSLSDEEVELIAAEVGREVTIKHVGEEGAEDFSGRCAAILANGKRCPNTALPGSRFCGVPAHQALEGTGSDYVAGPPAETEAEAEEVEIEAETGDAEAEEQPPVAPEAEVAEPEEVPAGIPVEQPEEE